MGCLPTRPDGELAPGSGRRSPSTPPTLRSTRRAASVASMRPAWPPRRRLWPARRRM